MPSHIRTTYPQPPMEHIRTMPPQPMNHVHQRTAGMMPKKDKTEMFGFLNQRIRFMKQEISVMHLIILAVVAYLLYKYCFEGKGLKSAPKGHLQYFFF
jgi:hypothetical protein